MSDDLEKVRDDILRATLRHVPFDGWTEATLAAGAADGGHGLATVARAFPDGVRGLVAHFQATSDRAMLAELERRDLPAMRVRERIATAVRVRLEHNAEHREAVRRMVAYLALPANAWLALRCLHRTVDTIWYAAGDTAADFNYYTKRGLLAGVYATTVLYWLNDESDGFVHTWAFLDRRIADALAVPKAMARATRGLEGLPNPLALWRGPVPRRR